MLFLSVRGGSDEHGGGKQDAKSASSAKEADEQDGGDAYCRDRLLTPFRRLTGQPGSEPPSTTLVSVSASAGAMDTLEDARWAELPRWLRATFGDHVRLDAMIATVPDPVDTSLGYQFDAQLQALQMGIEAPVPGHVAHGEGLYRDRDWLPWDDRASKAEDRTRSRECRHGWPGVILFRGSDRAQPSVLALLLVGESPVHGVHVRAMDHALEFAAHFLGAPGQGGLQRAHLGTSERPLRIVGPYFSGAALSLRHALDAHRKGGHCEPVRVVSGTATGPDVPGILRHAASPACDRTTYEVTTVPGQALECSFLYYVQRAGARAEAEEGSRTLDGVAVLQESGTEFGASLATPSAGSARRPCPLRPEVSVSFPHNISSIRDAYEELDAKGARPHVDPSIARHTSLAISLRKGARLDIEHPSSGITKFAQDLALGNVLRQIAQEGVRWVAIQATDIGDAVFLARKVRDVAPDVRLAFFNADSLLLHPSFEHDLLGSLVVSPYPFLGSDDFTSLRSFTESPGKAVPHAHASFTSDAAQGTFNAVRALRDVPADELTEYAFIKPGPDDVGVEMQPLPIWISAIGQGELVPVQTRPALDCDGVIYGGVKAPEALCRDDATTEQRSVAWEKFNRLRSLRLNVDPDVTPPRLWIFLSALLALVCVLHHRQQQLVEAEVGSDEYPRELTVRGDRIVVGDDSLLDRSIVRSKWRIYGLCAKTALALGVVYMTLIFAISAATYAHHAHGLRFTLLASCSALLLTFVLHSAWTTGTAVLASLLQFRSLLAGASLLSAFGMPGSEYRHLEPDLLQEARGLGRSLLLWLGFADTERDSLALYVSYAQMRGVLVIAAGTALLFIAGIVHSLIESVDFALFEGESLPAMTLFVLRSLPVANGASPAAPLLLSMVCCYLWAVGRMGRLRLLFELTRISPKDGVTDCVSTPIRKLLFPSHQASAQDAADEGFTRRERQLVNAVLRPSGHAYFAWLGVAAFLPLVLFLLKHPTTLEAELDTYLLFGSLSLCGILITATLVQLVFYWRALDVVLKRMADHPLSQAFARLPLPFRESVDAQVTQRHNQRLRLNACARALTQLWTGEWCKQAAALASPAARLSESVRRTQAAVRRAGAGQDSRLGQEVITAANQVAILLEAAWAGRGPERVVGGPPPGELPVSHDPLGALAAELPPATVTWLRAAETFVASVACTLISLHVRQFRYFLHTLTACSLVLLLAIASYPFEPHRTLMLCIWTLMGTVVLTCLWVFVQLDRDPLLSSIAGKPDSAGSITWNGELAYRVVVWVILPLLGLMAAQYPAVANQLTVLLEPFRRSLR